MAVHLSRTSNLLESLPSDLAMLPRMGVLKCLANPLIEPPKAVCRGGWAAVKSYFDDIATHGHVQNSDLKVLVVGLSEAGKTSLIKSIVRNDAFLVRQGDRTVGIEQNRYSFLRTPEVVEPVPGADPDPGPPGIEGKAYHLTQRSLMFRFENELACTLMFTGGYDSDDEAGGSLDDLADDPEASCLLEQATWDLTTRTFTGEVTTDDDRPYWLEMSYGNDRVAFTLVFSEAFDRVTDLTVGVWTAAEESDNDSDADSAAAPTPTPDASPPAAPAPPIHTRHPLDIRNDDGLRVVDDATTQKSVNLLLFDFAGQQEYYITHHIFLTERALYVLAFDLSKYTDATYCRQIEFWMNSIQDRVPGAKVIFVGTHADCLAAGEDVARCDRIRSTIKVKRRRAQKQLDRKIAAANEKAKVYEGMRRGFAEREVAKLAKGTDADAIKRCQELHGSGDMMTPEQEMIVNKYREFYGSPDAMSAENAAEEHQLVTDRHRWNGQLALLGEVPDRVYPVSSKTMQGMAELVAKIQSTVQDKRIFPELDETLPMSYLRVRDLIRAKRKEPSTFLLRTPEYLELFSRELGLTPKEVDDATMFMHDLGEVLYYNAERRTDGLDVIFLKVGFLIDALKCVIRHDHRDATVYRPDPDVPVRPRAFRTMKDQLMEAGILRVELLELLWGPPAPYGIGLRKSREPEKYRMLVQLLELFEVAAVRKYDPATGLPSELLVPEFEPMSLDDGLWDVDVAEGDDQVFRYFHFDAKSPPPRGMMQRYAQLSQSGVAIPQTRAAPHTPSGMHYVECVLSDADWCLQSMVLPDHRLQVPGQARAACERGRVSRGEGRRHRHHPQLRRLLHVCRGQAPRAARGPRLSDHSARKHERDLEDVQHPWYRLPGARRPVAWARL